MKMDSEMMTKHRFWLILAVAVPLTLFALFWVTFPVAGEIEVKRKVVEEELKKLKQFSDVKSEKWVEEARKKAEAQDKLKEVVWKQAWESQKHLMTWPETLEQNFHFQQGLFALAIKADRRKSAAEETPMSTEEGAAAPAAAPGAPETFTGVITGGVEKDYIEVVKKDKKKSEKKRFQRTHRIKVTISTDDKADDPRNFSDLAAGDRVTVTYQQGKYFGDELTDSEITAFINNYRDQLHPIMAQVQPVDTAGKGIVQLKGWSYSDEVFPPPETRFFNYVGGVNVAWDRNVEISREAWIAQEDLWIQREIYRLIRLSNDYIARFRGQSKDGKNQWVEFSNPYWHFHLRIRPDNKLEVKVKNLRQVRQKLDVSFKVQITKDRDPALALIQLEGEPMLPGETRNFNEDGKDKKFAPPIGVTPSGIYGVEQVLTWDTAAIKRVDQIIIGSGSGSSGGNVAAGPGPMAGGKVGLGGGGTTGGGLAHSHRTFVKGLKEFVFPGAAAKTAEATEPAPMTGETGQPAGGTGKPAENLLSKNGLPWKRYSEVTPQARRLPVAVVLIVEQEQVSRVQTAFSDSVLRFRPTQVLWHRYPHTLRPAESFAGGSGEPSGAVPMFGRPMPMVGSPGGAGAPYGTTMAGLDEPESNSELVLYGEVSLYSRFPPRPEGAKTE